MTNYDENLADLTLFIHSDPFDHVHPEFMKVVLQSIGHKTYTQQFLHVNGPRHVRTLTPCIQAIAEVIFEKKFDEVVGPYCCAQFLVSRERMQFRIFWNAEVRFLVHFS